MESLEDSVSQMSIKSEYSQQTPIEQSQTEISQNDQPQDEDHIVPGPTNEEGVEEQQQQQPITNSQIINLADIDQENSATADQDEDHSEFKDAVCEIQYDIERARQLKEKANEEFKFERYDECIRLYNEAIVICPPEEVSDLAIFHNNKGICYTKLKSNKEAKKEFSRAIELKADYVKPRALRMNVYRQEEEYDAALEDAKRIQEMDPSYPQIHKTVKDLDQLQKEKFEKMKTEVLTNLKSFGNSILGKFGMSLDNFKLNQNQDGTYNINYQNQ